jgi:hypothetical protein
MVEFKNKEMHFICTIAGCTGDPDKFQGEERDHILTRREETRKQLFQQIKIHSNKPGWKKSGKDCNIQ